MYILGGISGTVGVSTGATSTVGGGGAGSSGMVAKPSVGGTGTASAGTFVKKN